MYSGSSASLTFAVKKMPVATVFVLKFCKHEVIGVIPAFFVHLLSAKPRRNNKLQLMKQLGFGDHMQYSAG